MLLRLDDDLWLGFVNDGVARGTLVLHFQLLVTLVASEEKVEEAEQRSLLLWWLGGDLPMRLRLTTKMATTRPNNATGRAKSRYRGCRLFG